MQPEKREVRRGLGKLCAMLLVLAMLLPMAQRPASAVRTSKHVPTRGIAIVFDNSGSMYMKENLAWCQALYAMDVFAALMNSGDTLQIYPMHEIEAGGKSYSDRQPLVLRGGEDPSVIRDILTPNALGTPIKTIDAAYNGLVKMSTEEKWLIVLTDGASFHNESNYAMNKEDTQAALSKKLKQYNEDVNVMYLGIGSQTAQPNYTSPGRYKSVIEQAGTSSKVLEKLTEMSNTIFGRDALGKDSISGDKITLDVPMSKLIVFVQGENISSVSLKDQQNGSVGNIERQYSPRYGTRGATKTDDGSGDYNRKYDTSLQGTIVTYQDVPAGSYTIGYSGTSSSVAVYYEPDVDVSMKLVDANGNEVDPNSTDNAPGTYYLQFSLVDGNDNPVDHTKTSQLGKVEFSLDYDISGVKHNGEKPDKDGKIKLELQEDDVLNATVSATFLNGYHVTCTGEELGWPRGGMKILKQVGTLVPQVTGGQDSYPLSKLEEQAVYTVKLIYDGEPLTGGALEDVTLDVSLTGGNAQCETERTGEGFTVRIRYAGSAAETECSEYTLFVSATYKIEDKTVSGQADNQPFVVTDDGSLLQMTVNAPQKTYAKSDTAGWQPITVRLTMDGAPLTESQLLAVTFDVMLDGIEFDKEPLADESAYRITLKSDPAPKNGRYTLTCRASTLDINGKTTEAEASVRLRLQTLPSWVWWLIGLLVLCVLLILFNMWRNAKVLPKDIVFKTDNKNSPLFYVNSAQVGGAYSCEFSHNAKTGTISARSPHGTTNYKQAKGTLTLEVEADSPRKTPSAKRSAKVLSLSCSANVKTAKIGGKSFENPDFPKGGTMVPVGKKKGATYDLTISSGSRCELYAEIWKGEQIIPVQFTAKFLFQ